MFYPKIAMNSIKVNNKLYIPYVLTSALWVMMFYVIFSMASSEQIRNTGAGDSIIMILTMGVPFILLFSGLFLLYTNSFLSKMRNKEYALYNILGMNKRNISHILAWESFFTTTSSLAIGLFGGVLFYKLFELLLMRITKDDVNYAFEINLQNIIYTAIAFVVIFLGILIKSLLTIRLAKPIELLKSQNVGEKPPKANWFLGILGALALCTAYYISITAENPLAAINMFFVAVMLVVVGTYLIFIAGSVLLCRILQKNKKFYYKANHFISVSSMAYRMKRTGAGLAAICIFSTMVLVMLSSTFSLYLGNEDLLTLRYPKEINMLFTSDSGELMPEDFKESVNDFALSETQQSGGSVSDVLVYERLVTAGQLQGDTFELDSLNSTNFDSIYQIFFYDIDDYNKNMGTDISIEGTQVYIHSPREEFTNDSITIQGTTFTVKGSLDDFWSDGISAMTVFPTLMIVVDDLSQIEAMFSEATNQRGDSLLTTQYSYNYNCGLLGNEQVALTEQMQDSFVNTLGHFTHLNTFGIESLEGNRLGFYGLFGGLLFLGLILSILFIAATVLIIYYKQIVEGYEDKARFSIMQKIGITKKEIRRSVNSQMLTVFFLPLIMAGVHLCFAFPILRLFLLMFNLTNVMLFVIISAVGFVVFAIMYTFIYKLTSKFYFDIVSR